MTAKTYLPSGLPRPTPDRDGLDAPYWDGLSRRQLLVQRCRSCRTWQWGPEWICHHCHSRDMGWEEVDPRGIIYSWQRPWHPVHPTLKDFGPYVTVLVELPQAGGVRMIGNLIEDARADVQIGRKVTGYFERQDRDDWLHLLHWKYA